MIGVPEVTRIIEQYSRYGWRLRRASLSEDSIANVAAALKAYDPDLQIEMSSHESLWFSRRSLPDREAWELRRLSGSPFALVAVLEDSMSEDEREEVLRETELRMFDGSHPEPTSH
jgi:hypothetical protein